MTTRLEALEALLAYFGHDDLVEILSEDHPDTAPMIHLMAGMTYGDTHGNTWKTATEALDSFLGELPELSDDETETIFQFTERDAPAELNLDRIDYGIAYAGLSERFAGYPVPAPIVLV